MTRTFCLTAALLLGCAAPSPTLRNPYFIDVPESPEPDSTFKWNTRYAGACKTHGQFTNCSRDREGVARAVHAHNTQYHAGANDGDHSGKVFRCD